MQQNGCKIKLRMEECARDMGQLRPRRSAAVTGALIMLRMEECAGDMGQSANYATVTGALIML
jgi:hypothetical protein